MATWLQQEDAKLATGAVQESRRNAAGKQEEVIDTRQEADRGAAKAGQQEGERVSTAWYQGDRSKTTGNKP